MSRPANGTHLRMGDLLIPKRGRYLDPVTVIWICRPDKWAMVKDASVTSRDPGWKKNKMADRDGAERKTFRELAKDFHIACPDDRPPYLEYLAGLKIIVKEEDR